MISSRRCSDEQHSIDGAPNAKIFALVIGINKYQSSSVPNLEGAVPDANAIVEYLRDHLHVPVDHITTLCDHNATRNNITQALKNLASDPRIVKGDPIVIYYAGHGTELDAPEGWPTGGRKIQSLVPSDEGMHDASGETVSCIPDRTIGVLLDKLAESKGNNVTVILDSCHSAGGTRTLDESVRMRHVEAENLEPLRSDTDEEIFFGTRAVFVPDSRVHTGSQSHVLLAACGAKESAKEVGARGAFTKALLGVLYGEHPNNITYTEIMDQLPCIPDQTPHCEGRNRSRMLFDAKVVGVDNQFVRVLNTGGVYILYAGDAQGIEVGACFNIHGNRTLNSSSNPALASFTVVELVGSFRSKLQPTGLIHDSLPELLYARRIEANEIYELKVFFTSAFVEIMCRDSASWGSRLNGNSRVMDCGYVRTESKSEARLVVGLDKGKATYDTRSKGANSGGLVRIPHTTGTAAKEVLAVIRAVAKWNWHANRTNDHDPFKGKVKIDMVRLERRDGGQFGPVGQDLNASETVELVADGQQTYGLRLVNESAHDLYPYLFCFDANDLTIEPCYFYPHGGCAGSDAQLPGKGVDGNQPPGELTIGYGPSGSPGCIPSVPAGEDSGSCILKLFVTTSPTEFDFLAQDSPFAPRARKMKKAAVCGSHVNQDLWGTASITIVVRRPPSVPKMVAHGLSRLGRACVLPFPTPQIAGWSNAREVRCSAFESCCEVGRMPTPSIPWFDRRRTVQERYPQMDLDFVSMGVRMSFLASLAIAPNYPPEPLTFPSALPHFNYANGPRMPIPIVSIPSTSVY